MVRWSGIRVTNGPGMSQLGRSTSSRVGSRASRCNWSYLVRLPEREAVCGAPWPTGRGPLRREPPLYLGVGRERGATDPDAVDQLHRREGRETDWRMWVAWIHHGGGDALMVSAALLLLVPMVMVRFVHVV